MSRIRVGLFITATAAALGLLTQAAVDRSGSAALVAVIMMVVLIIGARKQWGPE